MIVGIDTGVADTWVNLAISTACKSATGCNGQGGSFDPTGSPPLSTTFQYTYVDATQAVGDYFSSTLTIGGQSLPGFEFVGGAATTPAIGRLGLSYPAAQVIASAGGSSYPTIYDILVKQGLINARGFSIWLDSPTAGQILFGGVNTARYSGDLGVVPIQQVDGAYKDFAISLTKITISQGAQSVDVPSNDEPFPFNVVLNSGSLFTYLPAKLAINILQGFGVKTALRLGGIPTAFAKCDLAASHFTVTFVFGSVKITIPAEAFLIPFATYSQSDSDGNQLCAVKIRPASNGQNLLGLTFFENAYIVFDLDKNQISLAQSKQGATDNNIIEIDQSAGTSAGSGQSTTTDTSGAPDLPGLTLVDPKDYASLDPSGTFIPLDDYLKAEQGSDPSTPAPDGGTFYELPAKDFDKIPKEDLVSYDQFMAEIGQASSPTTPVTANTPSNPTGGEDQVFTDDGNPQQVTDDQQVVDANAAAAAAAAAAAGTSGSTVIPATVGSSVVLDPNTGQPIDSSLVGSSVYNSAIDGGYYDPTGSYDDGTGTSVYKRVPAPAALRKRRV